MRMGRFSDGISDVMLILWLEQVQAQKADVADVAELDAKSRLVEYQQTGGPDGDIKVPLLLKRDKNKELQRRQFYQRYGNECKTTSYDGESEV